MDDSDEKSIKMTDILVALDHSHQSRAALETAAAIAKLMEAKIHGLFVHDDQWLRISKLPSLSEIDELTGRISPIGRESMEKQIRYLETTIKEHFELISRRYQLSYTWRTEKGSVAKKVLEAAKDSDIIIIGSKGRSYKRGKLGSSAVAIIRTANKPILILQKRINPGYPPIAIFDGSDKSVSGIKIGSEIAKRNNSNLTVIDMSETFQYNENDERRLDDMGENVKLLKINQPNMGRLLFMLHKLRGGLLILPKNKRFTKSGTIARILDSADCPVLIAH